MLFTPKQLAKSTTSYEKRFRPAYLSSGFDPTIVFASNSHMLISNLYRGMLRKRHCLGAADTGKDAIELVSSFMPNILALDDTLTDMSTVKIIDQAKQLNPLMRIALFITRTNEFKTYRNSPIVIAEQDILLDPNTLALFTMALITNTSYRSTSIEKRLKQLEQTAPDSFSGTIKLTPREHQLLEAYALGMSNQETAEKLGLSVRSIQTYSGNLLQKLGTSNRQKAVRRAISMGLSELAQLFTRGH